MNFISHIQYLFMVYGEITIVGKNSKGEDKIDFELYGASPKMIEDFNNFKDEYRKHSKESPVGLLHNYFDEEEPYYFGSRAIPLIFLAKHNFTPISKDFFFKIK